MKKRSAGIALITVILVSVVILILVMVGLGMTGSNLIFVSHVHRRNQALCAAEAGVYALLVKLGSTPTYAGPLNGQLADGSTYSVSFTRSGSQLDILSVGQMSGSTRKLKTVAAMSTDSYNALSSQGLIQAQGLNYVSGIVSTLNPLAARGNIHTNSASPQAFSTTGNISVTGLLSTVGGIQGIVNGQSQSNAPATTVTTLDKNSLLTGTFTDATTVPSNGVISGNTRITTDLKASQPIVLQNGAVLHIQGDAAFEQGITGQGTVVTDGMALVRGGPTVDTSNNKGVTLYSSQDMIVANPTVTFDANGNPQYQTDPIGAFFAGMPEDAPYILNQRLPIDAPTGVDFFTWYAAQSQSPSAAFIAWRDGDGSNLSPGIPADVKQWLNGSVPLLPQIQQWAAGG